MSSAVAFDRRWTRVLDQLLDDPSLRAHDPPAPRRQRRSRTSCARWPSRSSGRGTSSKTSCPSSAPSRPPWPTSCRSCHDELAALGAARARVHRPHRQPAGVGRTSSSTTPSGSASVGDDDLDLLEALGAACRSTGRARGKAAVVERLQGPGARAARRRVRHRRRHPRRRARRLRPPARVRPARHDARRRPTGAAPTAASSSTTCSCWPARCCATRCRARSCGPPSTSATSGCSSTSSRTPTRSRSSWPCASPPPIPSTPTRSAWRDVDVAPGPAVRGRRPQAVDLPLPPRRHLGVHGRPRPLRARAAPVELTANFRTVAPVIDWVNTTFRTLLEEAPDEDVPDSQPAYIDLQATRGRGRRSARRWRWSAPTPHPYGTGADDGPHRREPRRRPRDHHRPRRGLAGARRRRRLAAVPARRHHDPRPGPHVAAVPRGRPRGGRHPLPGRVELARVRHPGRPRPADGPAGGRRPHRPPAHRQRPAHAAARLRRRRPLPPQGAATAGRWSLQHAHAARSRRRHRVGRASRSCSRSTRRATGSRPPSCSTASPATGAPSSSASPRAGPATCGAGSGS